MKKFFGIMFALLVMMIPFALFAQEVPAPISDIDAVQQILAVLTTKGLSGLALVAAVVQVLMIALRSNYVIAKFGDLKGSTRITALLALTMVGGIVTLMMQGMAIIPAILHSTTIAAFQVLANQVYKQYFVKKD